MAVVSRRLAFAGHDPSASQAAPDPLLYALALMVWTYVWRVQDLVPVLSSFRINLIATAAAVGLFVIDRSPARRLGWLKTPILICALALVGVAIFGIPMSLYARRSATALITELIPNVLLMVMLAASIRGMRDLEWMALVNLLGACVYSLFVNLSGGSGPAGGLTNLVFYDANDLVLVLLCAIPFAILFVIRAEWRYRLLGASALILLILTVVSSDSRGGFIGFVAVSLYILFRYRAIPRRIRLGAVIGGFGLFSLVASDAYWEEIRGLTNPTQDYNWSGRSAEGRMEVWRRGLGYLADRPVLGVGLRNFPVAEGTLSPESRARAERGRGFKWSVAHNSFLEIGVELGLAGFAAFVGMIIATFRALGRIGSARSLRDSATLRTVALAGTLSASFIGYVVAGVFVSAAYYSFLYVLLGLTMGLIKIHRWRRLPSFAQRGRPSFVQPATHLRIPAGAVDAARLRALRRPGRTPIVTSPGEANR